MSTLLKLSSTLLADKEVYVLSKADLDFLRCSVENALAVATDARNMAEKALEAGTCCYPGELPTREEILAAECGVVSIDHFGACCS